ncbi:ABC transporter substrate-binding protein [Acetobacterium carbinolicum]|uniref:ABC transporter substrate-binding protein n=1 Tax=Acetobacterium carbinolicum TaxID=52690 RepID=UPI0039BF7750
MKRRVICMILVILIMMTGCAAQKESKTEVTDNSAGSSETVSITDMAGRTVEIPKTIDQTLSRSPVGTLVMYTLNPGKIAGQNWEPTESEKEYLDKDFLALPMLSGWYADGKVGNVEEIVKAAPDIIFSSFSGKATQGTIDQANSIQEQLKIPVVMIDSSLESMSKTYEFVGNLVGEEQKAEKLGQYIDNLLSDVKTKSATIDDEKRISVYYAEGTEGLQTDPSGSQHSELIDLIGAVNVAEVEIKSGMGRSSVSLEQLLQWAPEVIIACHDQGFAAEGATYDAVLSDDRFKTLDAVKNKKVYEVPYQPFNFFDRPPSVNRIIGIKWLGNLLYPEIYDYNLDQDTKAFYKLFYNIDLTTEQIKEIYKNSK